MQAVTDQGLADMCLALTPRGATADEIALCHAPDYIEHARHEIERGVTQLSTGDTGVCMRSFEVAQYAVGAVLRAVDAVMEVPDLNAFCVVRPPGHHATPKQGMGFCIFNNVAVGARYAQKQYGMEKVLIVDWDVHHGNGTQDIFYDDPSVFYFSTHQAPFYPFTGWPNETGRGEGLGTTLNCPFPAGAGRAEVLGAFEEALIPAMKKFKPDLVMISAGFDSRIHDVLGQFTLTDEDFVDLTRFMQNLADRYAKGRLVSVLEGGYQLHGLASAASAHLHELIFRDK